MPRNPFFRSPADGGGPDYPNNYAVPDQAFVCSRCNRRNEKGDRCAWCGAPRPRGDEPRREPAEVYAPPEYMMRRPRGPETQDDGPRRSVACVYAPPEYMAGRARRRKTRDDIWSSGVGYVYAPPEYFEGRNRRRKTRDDVRPIGPLRRGIGKIIAAIMRLKTK